jgi:death-on-curing protein
MDDVEFISYEELLEIHSDQLARYGGLEGFIDENVVKSALAQPGMRAFGEYLHIDIAEMAASYIFHFAASQGFVDGNKRTAALTAVTFLLRNGYRLDCPDEDLYPVVKQAATARMPKSAIADWIRERMIAQP